MQVSNVRDAEKLATPHQGTIKKLISYEHATIIHIALEPGEGLKMHVTPVDVCFHVLEGDGHVQIGKETVPITRDDLVFSPARIPHRLYNDGQSTFRFLVIKTPTPTTETRFL